jgi:endonuclease-3
VFSHVVTFHGRAVCAARKPKCDACAVNEWCDYYAVLKRA